MSRRRMDRKVWLQTMERELGSRVLGHLMTENSSIGEDHIVLLTDMAGLSRLLGRYVFIDEVPYVVTDYDEYGFVMIEGMLDEDLIQVELASDIDWVE